MTIFDVKRRVLLGYNFTDFAVCMIWHPAAIKKSMLLASIGLEMLRTPRLECGRLGVAVAYHARRVIMRTGTILEFFIVCAVVSAAERDKDE